MPLRILIVRTGAMGDILHALPAVAALRQALAGARIGWVVEPHWLPLLGPNGPVADRLHLAPTRAWKQHPLSLATARSIVSLRQELQQERYDITIDLQGSIRSATLGGFAAAPRFIGAAETREALARLRYTERVATTAAHVIDQACQIVSAITPVSGAGPLLPVDAKAEAAMDRLTLPPRFILMAPTAGWGAKQWPAEHYAELAGQFARMGHAVLLNAPPEDSLAQTIAARTGARALATTLAELIALTRRAALVIAGDTGPLHLAAALGVPALGLFGPTDPARTGAYSQGGPTRNLRHPGSQTSHKRLAAPEAGLARITVEEVLEAAQTLLAGSP